MIGCFKGVVGGFFVLLLAAGELWAVEDGAWNGKPWQEEELRKALERGDAEAKAEMAYWLKFGVAGEPVDLNEIYRLAKESADAGNAYGMAILSRCFETGSGVEQDRERALTLAKRSADAGHPLGLKNLANLTGLGPNADVAGWRRMSEKAAEEGCVTARNNLFKGLIFGAFGIQHDRERGIRLAIEAAKTDLASDLFCSQMVLTESVKSAEKYDIGEELVARAVARLELAAKSGLAEPMAVLGRFYCLTGNAERGRTLVDEAAKQDDLLAKLIAYDFQNVLSYRRKSGVRYDARKSYQLARDIHRLGGNKPRISLVAARSYVDRAFGPKTDPAKALAILADLKKQGFQSAGVHEVKGLVYFGQSSGEYRDKERGVAHYVYACERSPHLIVVMAHALADEGKEEDLVRAIAAGRHVIEKHRYPNKRFHEKIDGLKKNLSPEGLVKVEDLVERGYPTAKEFLEEARETLVRFGDLPEEVLVPE